MQRQVAADRLWNNVEEEVKIRCALNAADHDDEVIKGGNRKIPQKVCRAGLLPDPLLGQDESAPPDHDAGQKRQIVG